MKSRLVSRLLRRFGLLGDHRGLAALEFALMAPVLTTLFIGSVDAAQVYVAQLNLTSALYAGANYALTNQGAVTSTGAAALADTIATIVGNLNGTGWASGTVVVNNGPTVTFSGGTNTASGAAANANSWYCLTGSPGNWNWGTAQSSNTTSCGANQPNAGKFVTIQASVAVTPFIVGMSFVNGNISQSIVVQVQ